MRCRLGAGVEMVLVWGWIGLLALRVCLGLLMLVGGKRAWVEGGL